MSSPSLIAKDVTINALGGRTLFRGLELQIGCERVALVGRNGVGKSTLLQTLAGAREPTQGSVSHRGRLEFVPQQLASAEPLADDRNRTAELAAIGCTSASPRSLGEIRKQALVSAKLSAPRVLLLDEPSRDLDARGLDWLAAWLATFEGCLLVASHDRTLLSGFSEFLRVDESGCRAFHGNLAELECEAARESEVSERRYLANLNRLADKEAKSERERRRRRRKANGGRAREVDRAPSRALLNLKRSYAQESQGKRAKVRRRRIEALRQWTKSTRRALDVTLPLKATLPTLGPDSGAPAIVLDGVSVGPYGDTLVEDCSLRVGRDRVVLAGPNGSGKSTLLRTMLGELEPHRGRVSVETPRVGAIAQNTLDWSVPETLLAKLADVSGEVSPHALAERLIAHRFPLALAERPMSSLSPGERLRAALIALLARTPAIDVLVLDEPGQSLDLVGSMALRELLQAWQGGLVVATHDQSLIHLIKPTRLIELG